MSTSSEQRSGPDTDGKLAQSEDSIQDHGWAWIVAFAGFVALFLTAGVFRTLGLLLVELMDVYETTTTEVSLILMLSGVGMCVGALLMAFGIGDIVHERALLVVCGLIESMGFVVTYRSAKVEDVFVIGITTGAAMQIAQPGSVAMVGKYFKRRLSSATGLIFAGISVGTILLPPFMRWLFDEYTYRGAALIMAGICLNVLVCGALMRPVSLTLPNRATGVKQETLDSYKIYSISDEVSTTFTGSKANSNNEFVAGQQARAPVPFTVTSEVQTKSSLLEDGNQNTSIKQRNNVRGTEPEKFDTPQMLCSKAFEAETCDVPDIFTRKDTEAREPQTPQRKLRTPDRKSLRLNENNKLRYRETPRFQSFGSLLRDFAIRPTNYQSNQSSVWKSVKLSFTFFKDPSFLFLELYSSFAAAGTINLIQFYPAFTNELGMSNYESALLLSVVGGADLIGTLFYGILGDCSCLERYNLAMVPQFTLAVCCFLSQFASVFWSQAIFAVVIGFNFGACFPFRAVLLVDLFERTTLLRRIGITILTAGIANVPIGPIVGSIRDSTGSFKLPFHILGVIFVCSGLCLLSINIHQRCKRQRLQRHG